MRLLSLILLISTATPLFAAPPNVVLVITDDQGYGDVAIHGNSVIKTPNLDKLYHQSVRLTDYHVDPTCAPTRSALMTGRYSTRTGVWHTIMGRSLMSPDEVTMAEVLKSAGYTTAMFGKWHLGDNAPVRPQDQGFDEVLCHGGGGVGQTPDFFGNDYFDDTYFRNGKPEKHEGYCTDVWFDGALDFIESNQGHPFFAYISTNAPHGPYLVDEKYTEPYREAGCPGSMAPFYGMITNIDENMGRLMRRLKEWGLEENTILIFTTDNGTAAGVARSVGKKKPAGDAAKTVWRGFNAGMRGQKGSEYDGGHRVPCYWRWPAGGIDGGHDVKQVTAHVDLLPTLAQLCEAKLPADRAVDGKSLAPLITGGTVDWPERTLLVHSQRIEHPEKWRKSAVMTDKWRLVNGKELYDIVADPGQQKNLSNDRPDVVVRLRAEYESWWSSLAPEFDKYVRIELGGTRENPSRLTCHDWHTENGPVPWNQGHVRSGAAGNGFWAVNVAKAGPYELTLRRWPEEKPGPLEATEARLKIGDVEVAQKIDGDTEKAVFRVELPAGPARLQTWLTKPDGKQRGAYFAYVKRLD